MSNFLKLISAPAKEPVTFEEVMLQLRLDEMEVNLAALIATVRQHIDGRDGWLGRALITQTWELHLDSFPCDVIRIPLPPLQEIISIKYDDPEGIEQTIPVENYTVVESEPAQIIPAYGLSWPSTRCYQGAVRIQFRCGYGDDPKDVPMPIKQALYLLAGHWYENREVIATGAAVAEIPMTIDALLMPYRTTWL